MKRTPKRQKPIRSKVDFHISYIGCTIRIELSENRAPMLRIESLGFAYGEERVLDQVSFESERGSFTSLVGASGCGKSTLLRLVAGLKSPTTGSIEIAASGAALDTGSQLASEDHLAALNSSIGFVFQHPTLCPWLTALANVELPLKLRGVSKSDRRQQATAALDLVGLQAADVRKLPSQLSGGMQMRTSLARSFVTKPTLMLMDEPFAALDEVLRQQLCETTLRLWRREHWTTLFVTHNVAEAVFVSQRVHILAGSPATIVKTVEVPLGDRTPELRLAPDYLKMVSEVSRALRDAVEATSGESEELGAGH